MIKRYWILGVRWNNYPDTDAFYRQGYWELDGCCCEKPKLAEQRDKIQPGDRLALKASLGQASQNIAIAALGVVTAIEDKRIYVNWVLTDLDRIVPSRGCYRSIHGPFVADKDSVWLYMIFRGLEQPRNAQFQRTEKPAIAA